jgi:predicted Zn-dependent protease
VASDDWFRTGGWGDEERTAFEARLARARGHNRPQYLKIKAAALREAGKSAAAVELLKRVLDQYSDALDAPYCAELLGDIALEAGRPASAEAYYRESLRLRPDQNATSGEVHIGLAEALVAQGRFQEAVKALDSFPVQELTMNHSVCRWNMALAEAAHGLGDKDTASVAADSALAVLVAPDQFGRHAGVGRAVMNGKQVKRMKRLASRAALGEGARSAWFRRCGQPRT